MQRHEVLQAAEIFAGGFAGWSRALFSLRDGGVRTHMSWMLERDSACCTALQAMDNNVVTITSAEDIPAATQPCDTALLPVDFRQTWWRKVLHLRPVHLAFVSPPCQPWSRAGKGEGLASQDGSILLELAQLLQVTNIPVVVLEEVEGFPHHKDFSTVCAAMRRAGYCCRWKATLQLSDIAPASRRRFFMVWVREEWPSQPKHVADCRWQPNGRSTLASAKAVFDCLPKGLLEPCMLEPDVLQLCMMPELLPQGPNGKRPHDVRSARVRSADQPAACFLAQYHYQHQLPMPHLKLPGLLGVLFDAPQGLRFYAAPEIAVCQGVATPLLLLADDRQSMKILGNSLASHQAVFVAAISLQFFPTCLSAPDPVACTKHSVQQSLSADNSLLLQVDAGWIFCHIHQAAWIYANSALKTQVGPSTDFIMQSLQQLKVMKPPGSTFMSLSMSHLPCSFSFWIASLTL